MFIRTYRLLLRPPWPEDAAAITACLADGVVARNTAQVPHPYGLEDAKAFIDRCEAAEPQPTFVILGREGDDAPLAGCIGLFRSPEAGAEAGAWELGYWIGKDWWGRGYATEAAKAVLELAFLGLRLPRVVAGHFIDNPASGRVLEKLGFTETGISKRHCLARNCDVDCRNVALTREAWLAHRAGQVEMHAA
ncbi:GNAT family N-acetyltransferase [Pedomonas mirosovicensis]|uniref:GNAT family N-acetyltransferase n=1 Tax=Pedomonas mirosovicensis TaxID=2908641 RepID=UPI002168BE30|nr:GNAT family N-acetyltransferase [Pedomonas mirosovicensis]MCH8684543.1 GNAT family N-acetyltransferase [Pedomonas mirosovicensis]